MITGIVVALLLAVIVFQYMIIKIDKDKRHEAGHDKLTGLCNPEHLMQKMKELPDKKKNRLIIYSDIAEFKLINEIFGIEKGNEILLKQADIIKKHAVDGYLYGRVGEDHFVVIADEATFNEEHLYECRETLQNVLSDSVYNVRVCFGIYRTDNMNESLSFMCDKASFAVASIKDDTHSFIAYYDDTMLEATIKYKTIVDEFDDAIKAGEFKMYLQPQISAKTRRLTGADLENILNEAAINAAKSKRKFITNADVNYAFVKVGIGVEKRSKIISEKEKKITAYHESGHAILFHVLPDVGPVHTISIIPTGMGAAGYTMPLPDNDEMFNTKGKMLQDIMTLLGGRIAEEIIFGDITTGASNDIKRATATARSMVMKYGMSDKLGLICYGDDDDEVFIGRDLAHTRGYGEGVATTIDLEVKRIIDECYEKAKQMIAEHRDVLDACANLLLEKEKISQQEFEALFEQ